MQATPLSLPLQQKAFGAYLQQTETLLGCLSLLGVNIPRGRLDHGQQVRHLLLL